MPNGNKICQMAGKLTKWPCTNIFHYKTPQNLPPLGFLVPKETIWQPWVGTKKKLVCKIADCSGTNQQLGAKLEKYFDGEKKNAGKNAGIYGDHHRSELFMLYLYIGARLNQFFFFST
jgi:hypothetical protein